MIVAGPEGFRKNQYRKFNIRSEDLTPGDDYGMMREVLERRFKRLMEEHPRAASTEQPSPLVSSSSPPPLRGRSPAEAGGEGGREGGETQATEQEIAPLPIPPPQGGREESAAAPPTAEALPRAAESGSEQAVSEEDDDLESPWPDLVLIDGGQGQLKAAAETLGELGVTGVPLVAVAKGLDRDAGRETFFMAGRTPFKLPPRDPLLYYIERLRDEAHRFAIGSHRARRKKDIREAGLQEIPGVGPTRKRALLRHFGTVKAIERASLPDLAQVPGINAETARKIYEFFHEQAR
jgi:excinuclease ABC subunit C